MRESARFAMIEKGLAFYKVNAQHFQNSQEMSLIFQETWILGGKANKNE